MILNRSLTVAEIIILCLMVAFISISLITAGQSKKSSAFYFGLRGTVIPTPEITLLSFNSTHDLVVERTGDPLVSVTIQEARICNGTEVPPLSMGRTSFKYFLEPKRECDKNIDERFQVVASIGEDDFYKLNDPKLADLLLNSQAASGKYNYSIQARKAASFAQSCRSTMDFVPKILEKEILVEQSASNVRFLMWLMFY